MRRAGIFFIDVSDGVIDEYKIFLLREAKKFLSRLIIVGNENLTDELRGSLENFADEISFDKKILADKNKFLDCDELILFNDNFFGPIYPFNEMFSKMDAKFSDADFWGITIHEGNLQEDFLVFREKILHSEEFSNYWQSENNFSVTKYFSEKNFSYAVYCDTRDFEKIFDVKIDFSIVSPEKLLKDYRCPVLNKKIFSTSREDFLKENYGDEPQKCLDFVKNFTDYDENLILENILRENNIAAIKSNLASDYILPTDFSFGNPAKIFEKTAVVAHLYYEDLFSECAEYLCRVPKKISIIVTVDSEQKKSALEKLFKDLKRKCEIRIVDGRGRDLAALLAGCGDVFKKFKYLCFVHDKKSFRKNESAAIGGAFLNILWQNVLGSENFVKNILSTFENEKQLGLLVPPQPYHGNYRELFFTSKFWSGDCFSKTLETAEMLGISKKFFDSEIAPLSIGTVFWCRTAALKKISAKNWSTEDFPAEPMPIDGTINHALERILPFAAQSENFFTGILMTDKFAGDEIENFLTMYANAHINLKKIIQETIPRLEENHKSEIARLEEKHKSEIARLEEKHKSEIARLEEKNKNLSLQLNEQKKINSAMKNSTSWKITAPLRRVKEVFKNKD